METAVQAPPSYPGREPCLEQAGPSSNSKKSCPKKPFDPNRNKRRGSFSATGAKRRRRNDIVLPTKFQLGGNITDPLNLKSLENEEVNRLANQTPVASPATGLGGGSERVEVIIPQNINDPLNLNGPEPVKVEAPAPPVKKNRRRRNRNMKRKPQNENPDPATASPQDEQSESAPPAKKPRHTANQNSSKSQPKQAAQRFRYGNYNRYYGYRNATGSDTRLPLLKEEWFQDKVCLDIGCNVGHLTLTIARDFKPKQMIGLDIDPDLIRMAKKNIRHYVHQQDTSGKWFPMSCPLTFGPITMSGAQAEFPHNIFFLNGNYVLDGDDQIDEQCEQFDTIMCLSTTKWIQLNFGDEGLKRAFRRVFKQLRPGGRFILEPQPLSSYHKFCSAEHRENYRKMQLKPDAYAEYLQTEVGFESSRVFGVGCHGSKGFQRPLYLFKKAKSEGHQSPGKVATQSPKKTSKDDETDSKTKPSPARECDTTTASI